MKVLLKWVKVLLIVAIASLVNSASQETALQQQGPFTIRIQVAILSNDMKAKKPAEITDEVQH